MHAGRNSNEECAAVWRIVLYQRVLAIHPTKTFFGGHYYTMGDLDKRPVYQEELRKDNIKHKM